MLADKHKRVAAAGLLVLLAAAGLWGIRLYGLDAKLPEGLAFGGIPVGGLPLVQAEGLLDAHLKETAGWRLRFASDVPGAEQSSVFGSTGLRWDASAPKQAVAELKEGSPYLRAWRKWQLRKTDLPMGILYDESVYTGFLKQTWAELNAKQPIAAKRMITGQDWVEIIPDIPVYRVDEKKLLDSLLATDWLSMWRGLVPDQKAADTEPVVIPMPLTEIRAQITYDTLTGQGIERKISEFATTILPGSEGRLHNVVSAAKTIHDRVLAPGDIFDYAPVIEETKNRFGFQEAPVIYNGKLVPGVGGGICQVSSTLYNAVLRAGLEIVERRNHSLPVSYVPLGQDATFSEGYINFRFRNNTGAHLLIRTVTEQTKLTVKLFGKLPQGQSFDIQSVTVEELEAPVKTVINPTLRTGQREVLQKGKPGYVVETYRTKRENGTILSRELISRDRYQPQPALIAVGGKAGEGTGLSGEGKEGVLEDGVEGPRFR
ncbi:MAG: VanW protein [Paenibacillaceae bacterium]|jgi:vancomycin resistance protein YoaR|nr:VanW protein [Paenibacillaceae bacterium]